VRQIEKSFFTCHPIARVPFSNLWRATFGLRSQCCAPLI